MTLWFVFALMTAAAVFAVLWPLGRKSGTPSASGSEAVVYVDQLAEVGRDAEAGLIGPAEAKAARVEISRRLLEASRLDDRPAAVSSLSLRRGIAIAALVGVPAAALLLYGTLGAPTLPDFPLAQREKAVSPDQPLVNLVAQVEAHLEKNPNDARGWSVLAPVLFKLGRYEDAVRANRNILRLSGETAVAHADLGETLVAAANGVVTADAKAEFERAVALDPSEAKARFFTGLAAEQDGRNDVAADIWRAMLQSAPADAPWRPMVSLALRRVSGPDMPKLSDDTIASAEKMSEGDRAAMVQGMIDRLATRLKTDGNDVQGWLRLVRAYVVSGQRDKADAALGDARQALGRDADRLKQLNEGLKDLGLDG